MSVSTDERVTQRRGKRLRKYSSDDISIEELVPDDMGYEADVEALHPDVYEEPDSDADAAVTPKKRFHSIDEELAARMKHLGSERSDTNSPLTPSSARGRKRRSLHEDIASTGNNGHSELEVMEVPAVADRAAKSPPKKRRKRSKPGSSNRQSDASFPQNSQCNDISNLSNDVPDSMDLT